VVSSVKKPGQIITFYSYKGGVGRSRALANTAYQLASGGKRVLCLDFDLEAPGLINYFEKWNKKNEVRFDDQLGIVDLLYSYKEFLLLPSPLQKILDWKELIYSVEITDEGRPFNVDIIGPGRQSEDYGSKVMEFDWQAFYENWEGGRFIEHLRDQFRNSEYDYVLIDSRTGISDIGGLCTVQFPTILVVVFTSSPQSLRGLEIIIDNIRAQHRVLRKDITVPVIPLPSRIDRKEEKGQYDLWFNRVAKGEIGNLLAELRPQESIVALLQKITIEYVPWYTYKDELESDLESIEDIGANAWRFKNLTQLIYEVSEQSLSDPLRQAGAARALNRLADAENKIGFNLENLFDIHPGESENSDKAAYSDKFINLKTAVDSF
jgi:MinD-like ATPase involved in chromosome partitioning or flagellar assembly